VDAGANVNAQDEVGRCLLHHLACVDCVRGVLFTLYFLFLFLVNILVNARNACESVVKKKGPILP
jgi:hypothetical protein